MSPSAILSGTALGLGAAVPIGPVNVEIARRSLRGGFFAGVAFGCGAVTVDITYAIVSSLGVRPLLGHRWIILTLSVGGQFGSAWLRSGGDLGDGEVVPRDGPQSGVFPSPAGTIRAKLFCSGM